MRSGRASPLRLRAEGVAGRGEEALGCWERDRLLEITVLPPQLQGSHASVEGEVVNRGRGRRRNKEKKDSGGSEGGRSGRVIVEAKTIRIGK